MSHLVECQTEFRDQQALVAALVELGFQESQVQVHAEAVPLYGGQVIARQQRARGRSVEQQRLPGGEIEVTIAGYR